MPPETTGSAGQDRITATAATFRYAPADCPNQDHESGMVYDPERDDAVCPLCGTHATTEMGSL